MPHRAILISLISRHGVIERDSRLITWMTPVHERPVWPPVDVPCAQRPGWPQFLVPGRFDVPDLTRYAHLTDPSGWARTAGIPRPPRPAAVLAVCARVSHQEFLFYHCCVSGPAAAGAREDEGREAGCERRVQNITSAAFPLVSLHVRAVGTAGGCYRRAVRSRPPRRCPPGGCRTARNTAYLHTPWRGR